MKICVVGSGPSGVAAAHALIAGGATVEMLDWGNTPGDATSHVAERLRAASPAERAAEAKTLRTTRTSAQSFGRFCRYLLGREPLFELFSKRYLGSRFSYEDIEWGIPLSGSEKTRSLARGGLSNIWGASCYPLTREDYARWPLEEHELAPHYREVSRLLSLQSYADGLSPSYPCYDGEPGIGAPLSVPSRLLFEHWRAHEAAIASAGIQAGRSRLAVRVGGENGCRRCGLCLTGCPYDAIFRSEWTLAELERSDRFTYRGDSLVRHFEETAQGCRVFFVSRQTEREQARHYDAVFLAAGALSSVRIVADSLRWYGRPISMLDNDLYLGLFALTPHQTDARAQEIDFTLNELALRTWAGGTPVHVQLYPMSMDILHRLGPAGSILPRLGLQLMLAFVYFPGETSVELSAEAVPGDPVATLRLAERRSAVSRRAAVSLFAHFYRHRHALGFFPLTPPMRSAPSGAGGGHVAGGLPMGADSLPLGCTRDGKLNRANRVYVVDGACFPSLPAQNSTLTMMANAHRIAARFIERARADELRPPGESSSMHNAAGAPSPSNRFGAEFVDPRVLEVDHHTLQYEGPLPIRCYHRLVLRTAVRTAALRPGMKVLDYGCGRQQLRAYLPAGIEYLGYDLEPRFSDTDRLDGTFDLVFAIQVLFYLDFQGVAACVERFAQAAPSVVIMLPSRNPLKDRVLDRLLGLSAARESLARSTPSEIYERFETRFSLEERRSLVGMGEVTRWARKEA